MQDAITSIEKCRKSVIACVHGACIGGGVDIVSAYDVWYCTEDAFFSVKEVDLAITMDLGSLQRRFLGLEVKELGLVSKVFGCRD
ncbi:putative enoyl-CoA hydratase/isomerase, ClpP/crotonase-like domain superfamily [Helianthus annuus]|nr:putative enoyl-CoA hydratase/isomerase, ClpP/crotonase-like domain superfamily [Helianthus annuus]KAJ0818797.1 putative enoyl-CoA hydratase/isomerase, ClpP/crotonase-like domain superfamily [Helianthus annuus]